MSQLQLADKQSLQSPMLPSMILLQLQGKQFNHQREALFCSAVVTAEGAVQGSLFCSRCNSRVRSQIESWRLPYILPLQLLKEQSEASIHDSAATAGQAIHQREAPFRSAVATAEGAVQGSLSCCCCNSWVSSPIEGWSLLYILLLQLLKE